MIRTISAVILLVFFVAAAAQNTVAPKSNSVGHGHGKCRENDDPVGYPLQGWVGYTNTGKPVSHMTVQAFIALDKPPVATAVTDESGRFSLPSLGQGRFYLRATAKLVGETVSADDVVTVIKGKHGIVCLVAEGEPIPE